MPADEAYIEIAVAVAARRPTLNRPRRRPGADADVSDGVSRHGRETPVVGVHPTTPPPT